MYKIQQQVAAINTIYIYDRYKLKQRQCYLGLLQQTHKLLPCCL